MNKLFIIVRNQSGNPKIPVRWGVMGDGRRGYCLSNGHIVCFSTFEEADNVLESFTEPYFYDILVYEKEFEVKGVNCSEEYKGVAA